MSSLAYKTTNINIVDRIINILNGAGLAEPDFSVEPLKMGGLPDIAIFIKKKGFWGTGDEQELLNKLSASDDVESVRINKIRIAIRIRKEKIASEGERIAKQHASGLKYDDLLIGEKIMVDFCDPNLNKALHAGHLRNLIIGNSLSSVMAAMGASLIRQSIACDTGRSMCEALAGYQLYAEEMASGDDCTRMDVKIGKCYAMYVSRLSAVAADHDEPDSPIARELENYDDLAQKYLNRIREGDDTAIALGKKLSSAILQCHRETFHRLGFDFDEIIFESDYLRLSDSLISTGRDMGIFKIDEDGRSFYQTGRKEYSVIPLTRSDGFPTEHMRAIAIWHQLQRTHGDASWCFHIMGNEWLVSTAVREEILAKMCETPLYKKYVKIPYEMVRYKGSTMKSSIGSVVLIDDLFGQLEQDAQINDLYTGCQGKIPRVFFCRLFIYAYFIHHPMADIMDFSMDDIMNEKKNPAPAIASILMRTIAAVENEDDPDETDGDEERFLIVHAQFIRRYIYYSFVGRDPNILLRFLAALVNYYQDRPMRAKAARIMLEIQLTALRSIGLSIN